MALHDNVVPVMVTVVGLAGALEASSAYLVEEASVLIGSARQLAAVPAVAGQRRELLPSPLVEGLVALLDRVQTESEESDAIVVLASGDPLLAGIGTTLIDLLGPDRVRVVPAVSSVALARAELGWSAESSVVVRVTGADVSTVAREFASRRRIIVLSADEDTPRQVADLLVSHGFGASVLHVLANLGLPEFSHTQATASNWSTTSDRLNVIGIEVVGGTEMDRAVLGWVAGLPDESFEHDGQLTKRDLRASALARLAPKPGELLWDVGAGAGSVGIEWMRAHRSCRTIAIEAEPTRAERIERNAIALGVSNLQVVAVTAPAGLADLPAPDAVFVGGGATAPGVIDACLAALKPGGRLVVHGVTVETERVLAELHQRYGGELIRISVESAQPIGSFTGFKPARAVTQLALVRAGL